MHKEFASIYDEFTKYVDYNSWYKFLRKYIKKPDKILDIGCGTATITSMFFKDKFDVVGLDISEEMIKYAKIKNDKIKYVCLDIQKEYIQDKFKYITCNFDTVNYLEDFNKFISHCSKMQDEGGILIFDIVTEDIFDEIFESDIFLDEEENYTAIWTHKKEKKNRHRIDISIFKKEKSNIYTRYDEHHKKYIYEMEEVIDVLNNNGYVLYDVAKNPKYGYSRIFVIAKKE